MYVIMDRPAAYRRRLKPVQRRIIYAMSEAGSVGAVRYQEVRPYRG